jgi:hypothetical protein
MPRLDVDIPYLIWLNNYKMEKKSMYFDVNNTKICRDHYRPSTGIIRLIKNVWTVLLIGESPINHPSSKRRIH